MGRQNVLAPESEPHLIRHRNIRSTLLRETKGATAFRTMAKSNDIYEQVRPPAAIKDVYKKFQRLKGKDLTGHPDVIDLAASGSATWSRVRRMHLTELPEEVQVISEDFLLAKERLRGASATRDEVQDPAVFEVTSIPGKLCSVVHSLQVSEKGRSAYIPFSTLT